MPLLKRFDTPASLRDVPAGSPFYEKWSSFMSRQIGGLQKGDGGGAFYNAMNTEVSPVLEKNMTWMGFSRELLHNGANSDNRVSVFADADADAAQRLPQIEYFEWRAERKAGTITRVCFVTETADYYQQLWAVDRAAVLKLYRKLVSPAVREADLHIKGVYNKFNRWNTTDGIVHYIHPVNSFKDAVGLSRDGIRSEPPFGDNYEARPVLYNRPTSADPRISLEVHMLIRKGLHVTMKNPVGLYMAGWENSGITHPDGSPAGNYWKVVRGTPDMALRLEYEVPEALGFAVGDLRIGGRRIEWGGQLAEHVTVNLLHAAGYPKKTTK